VRERLRVRDVVDGDEINLPVSERGAQDIAPDAPETVDADFHCHVNPASSPSLLS
jgi:hypothetical protein